MTAPAVDHARQHYASSPGAERQALDRLANILRALRLGVYEDPQEGLATAADYVAASEFSATCKYAGLLQFQADTSGNAAWQQLAEDTMNRTAARRRDYATAITDPDVAPAKAVETMHRLCCEDFNARIAMVMACPQIYTESRLR